MNFLHQYDEILRITEENILENKNEIKKMAFNLVAASNRDANIYFKIVNPEQMSILQYIRCRQTIRGLKEYIETNTTIEKICEKYHFSDPTNFYDSVEMYTGEKDTPKMLKKAGYTCPEPEYMEDVLKSYINSDESESVRNDNKILELERKNRILRQNYDALKKIDQYHLMEISCLKDEKEMVEEIMENAIKKKKQEEKENELFTYRDYKRFMKIEDLRLMYNFTTTEILELHKESIETGRDLEELCDEALESCRFWLDERDESDYNIEAAWANLSRYEMGMMESYNYYYSDDDEADMEPDPYEEDDFEELDFPDMCYDSILAENEKRQEEPDNEPSEEELEKIRRKVEYERMKNENNSFLRKHADKNDNVNVSDVKKTEAIPTNYDFLDDDDIPF